MVVVYGQRFAAAADGVRKVSPASGATGLGNALTLSWGAANNATGYQVCVDTTNDGVCSTTWESAGTATVSARNGLSAGTYYWQVLAQNAGGTTAANGGTWWSFTVGDSPAPASTLAKASPANGVTGQSSAVTLTWSAVTDAGYWVCWDTTNNNRCDGAWMPNGGGTGRTLTGLAAGTYYWQVLAQNAGGTTDRERRDVVVVHGRRLYGAGIDVCEGVAGQRRDRPEQCGDADVVGRGGRGLLGMLGHDEQQQV